MDLEGQVTNKRRMNQRLASTARNLVTLLLTSLIFIMTSQRRKL